MSITDSLEINLTRPERYPYFPETIEGELSLEACREQVVTLTYHEVASLVSWAAEIGQWTSEAGLILFDGASDPLKRSVFGELMYQADQDERGAEWDRFVALWELWIAADTETRAEFLLAFHQDVEYRKHVDAWLEKYEEKKAAQAKADEEAGIWRRGTSDEIDYDDRECSLELMDSYGALRFFGTQYYKGYGPNGKIDDDAEGGASDEAEGDDVDDDDADETSEETFEESTADDSPTGVHADVIAGDVIADEVGGVEGDEEDDEECDSLSVDDEDDLLEAVNAFTMAQTNEERENAKRAVIEIMEQRPMRVVDCDADNGFPTWTGLSLPHDVGVVPAAPTSQPIPPTPAKPVTFERFTDRARRVMQLANQEAQRLNHPSIGTEHILLGLAKEGEGVAAKVLGQFFVEPASITAEVERLVQTGLELVTMGKLPLTDRATKVVEFAHDEAKNMKHHYVGTEHILLGLICEGHGIAAHVLGGMGLHLPMVRAVINNFLGRGAENVAAAADYELQPVEAEEVPATV